jgi:HK97 gp10 family phage protein
MAKFDFDFEELLAKQMEQLDVIDEIAPKMLESATPILEKNLKTALQPHKQTSEMVDSIKATKPKKGTKGWTSTVRPTGKDKKGVRNMEKLVYLQYGTSKQVATPVLEEVVNKSTNSVSEIMQEVFNREISK